MGESLGSFGINIDHEFLKLQEYNEKLLKERDHYARLVSTINKRDEKLLNILVRAEKNKERISDKDLNYIISIVACGVGGVDISYFQKALNDIFKINGPS